ncbi:MAG: PEP-CTERM sorting domain-containing protein [Planctomycetota bacterium]
MRIDIRNLTTKVALLITTSALVLVGSHASAATVIASQDFEGNSLSRGIPAEATAVSMGFYNDVTGVYTMPGLSWDSSTGLPFTHSTNAATPEGVTQGSDSGDVIGVFMNNDRDFGTSNGACEPTNGCTGATGQTGNFYIVEDADSTWTVTFDAVDTAGYSNLQLDFTWAVDNDGGGSTAGSNFETSDFIDVTVNGTTVFFKDGTGDHVLGDAVGGLDDLNAPYINNWAPESVDISAFDGQVITVAFNIANNAAPEDIAFDNVVISGVPEPSSLLLLLIGSLAGAARLRS